MVALTPHTTTDHQLLRKELAEIRDVGYARNCEESELGATSIGAPIHDVSGAVVAALSVAGPTPRIQPDLPAITHAVVEAAAVASRRLGHRSPHHPPRGTTT